MNKNFIIVLFLILLNSGGLMLPILNTLFFNDLGFGVKAIGIIMSFFGIGGLIGGYIGGHLADYIHSKNIVSISILGNGVFILLFSFLQDITLFAICMFFIGCFNASFRPSSILLLLENKGSFSDVKVLSYRRVANSIGFAIASFGFGFLYHIAGKSAFTFIGLTFIFTFFLSFILKSGKANISEKQEKEVKKRPNLSLFIGLNLISMLFIMIFNQYGTTYTLFLENFVGLSVLDISVLFTFHGILIIIFQIPVGYFSDKINLSLGCFIGSILLALGMGLTNFATSFQVALFFCAIWTFAEMILPPLSLPLILKTSIYKKGKTMGMYQTFFSSGIFLAPLFGSFFYNISPTLLWNLCFAISIFCAVFFLALYQFYEKAISI